MKKTITLLLIALCSLSVYSADLVLNNFNDITCVTGTSGAFGSTMNTVNGTGVITVPANNTGEYIYFSLPANFDVNPYQFLKISVKSSETNYRFVPSFITPEWTESSDWNGSYKYTGANAWQDIYIALSGMTPGTAGTYSKIALKVAAYDAKPAFDLYIDNITFIAKYVPDYSKDVIVCNFDNVIAPMGAWSNNTIGSSINPNGSGNVGIVSVPANNDGGITFNTIDKINTATHDKISFKVFATQAFTINFEKLEDKTNNTINQSLGLYPAYTTPNQWQELSMDISAVPSNIYDKIVLFSEAWQSKPAFTFYIDDVTLVKKVQTSIVDIKNATNSLIDYSSSQKTVYVKCDGDGLLELITLTGVVTKSVNFHRNTTLELSGINNGVYFVRLKNSGIQEIKKIIVGN
ncbi:MAG: T9SS type A sorting domain-containing protein [Bacteroidia bacterium]|nr:T9SS type A sorting domain-containing protein [Bacteroidia bacterium]